MIEITATVNDQGNLMTVESDDNRILLYLWRNEAVQLMQAIESAVGQMGIGIETQKETQCTDQ